MRAISFSAQSPTCQNQGVSQQTLVLQIPASEHAALRERLDQGSFEFRSVPHALLSVKGEGVVATLYKSGKFVVQGAGAAFFLERFGGGQAPRPKAEPKEPVQAEISNRTTVGSDETGKGDFFGPLVVCAVRLNSDEARHCLEAGVMDSKRITDPKALQLGAWLRREVRHSLQVLNPKDYNRAWKASGLHTLLSRQHAAAIRAASEKGDRVIIDQFSKKDEIGPLLKDLKLDIEQRPKAESEVAVAAASIIARAEFLILLRELGSEFDLVLRKGAGAPVDAVGAEFVTRYGIERLGDVAKVHFKNTEKVMSLLRGR
ncbi:MAG: ribonuclease HIII [Planctomycetota bacterium]|jgi:ribonuclease HIII